MGYGHGLRPWVAFMSCLHGLPSWFALMGCLHELPSWVALMGDRALSNQRRSPVTKKERRAPAKAPGVR